jgi:hypothetical protein
MSRTVTIRGHFKVDGTLTDVTTAKLSDPTETFGLKETVAGTVIVADGTAMTKSSTGVYEYTQTGLSDAKAYTAYMEFVYGGSTYHVEKDFPILGSSTYGYSYYQLTASIGDFLGYGRNSEGQGSDWNTKKVERIEECVRQGYWRFVYPQDTPGETTAHRWSFMNPQRTFDTVANDFDYDLPADFGAPAGNGDIFYDDDEYVSYTISQVSPGMIDRQRAHSNTTGRPTQYAIRPKAFDQTAEQTQELLLYPTPDAVYGLLQPYQAKFTELSSVNLYPMGGQAHRDTILQSCRAVAAQYYKEDVAAFEHDMFLQRLKASVEYDRRNSPGTLGYNNESGQNQCVVRHGDNYTCSLRNNL